jgi:hypothetical protein
VPVLDLPRFSPGVGSGCIVTFWGNGRGVRQGCAPALSGCILPGGAEGFRAVMAVSGGKEGLASLSAVGVEWARPHLP